MNIAQMVENAFYLLALLNPASKIMFLASYEPGLTKKQNFAEILFVNKEICTKLYKNQMES